jgi:uncharacterized protein (DUF58 family)
MPSARRGDGTDIVGLRGYAPGDDLRRIDHRASARASYASGGDVLLVREFFAEEAARVMVVLDRAPTMGLFPPEFPWLRKREATTELVHLLARSAWAAGASIGCLAAADGEPFSWPPLRRPRPSTWTSSPCTAPAGSLEAAVGMLAGMRRLGKGTFAFVVSDLLVPPGDHVWWPLLARGLDVVPVILQDPVWERSFPDVGGIPVPVAPVDGGRTRLVRVSRREAHRLRQANEARYESLLRRLRALGLEPVSIASHDPAAVHDALALWAAGRAGTAR